MGRDLYGGSPGSPRVVGEVDDGPIAHEPALHVHGRRHRLNAGCRTGTEEIKSRSCLQGVAARIAAGLLARHRPLFILRADVFCGVIDDVNGCNACATHSDTCNWALLKTRRCTSPGVRKSYMMTSLVPASVSVSNQSTVGDAAMPA